MADANPTMIQGVAMPEKSLLQQNSPSTLPAGKGNHLRKITCPICKTKYGYWVEEGDPGCVNCEINESIERTTKLKAEQAVSEKEAFNEAVAAEVKAQVAVAMAEIAKDAAKQPSDDPAERPQDEQEKKKDEKKSKRPFSKK